MKLLSDGLRRGSREGRRKEGGRSPRELTVSQVTSDHVASTGTAGHGVPSGSRGGRVGPGLREEALAGDGGHGPHSWSQNLF